MLYSDASPHRLFSFDTSVFSVPGASVQHAITAVRAGGIITITAENSATTDTPSSCTVMAAEAAHANADSASALAVAITPARWRMLYPNAAAFPPETAALSLPLPHHPSGTKPTNQDWLRQIIDPTVFDPTHLTPALLADLTPSYHPAGSAVAAAIDLMKQAGLLPAALVCSAASHTSTHSLAADAIFAALTASAASLRIVAEARLPLQTTDTARLVAFRTADGGTEHMAIIIGTPTFDHPVSVRVHSACFTGDSLGSQRCDCGEQLQGAFRTLDATGGGVVLYLAQEGRGIGLINKLRAYQMQDAGLDTIDANTALGFEEDERTYHSAAHMLQLLGIQRIRLLTNNPDKVQALQDHGIDVIERVPHSFPANGHNQAYLKTKAARAGHFL